MPIYKGNTKIVKLYKGSTQIVKRYKGTDLIYSASRLPAEFQEVEYIESSGTQYINSGVILTENDDVEIVFANTQIYSASSGAMLMFGSRQSASVNNATLTYNLQFLAVGLDYGDYSVNRINVPMNDTLKHIVKIVANNRVIIDNQTFQLSSVSFTTITSCYLFYASGNQYEKKLYEGRIYKCKIGSVRNFIPCYRKADNEIGLYDLVNGVFYTNAGTGTFTKGQDV